jgi:glycosyltransferase involved in cell wall biosynthesis
MRIAFVTNHPGGNAGCEKLWIAVAERMVHEGASVGVSMASGEEIRDVRLIEFKRDGNIEFHFRKASKPTLLNRARNRLLQWDGFNPTRQTVTWLKRFAPDVAVLNQGANIDARVWMTACRELNLPYITIAQCAAESIWPVDDEIDELVLGFHGAAKNFFVSQKNLDLTRRILGTDVPNAAVCGNAYQVDYDIKLPWPTEKTLQLACVARLHPSSKGQDILFEVLAESQWRDRDYQINLYGSGPNERSMKRLVSSLGLDSRVTFKGHVDHPADIWRKNHALVLASRYEGKPLAIIEAMLCARPVIVTDVAGNAEEVEHGVSGFVAASATVPALRNAMEDVWTSRDRFEEIGRRAAEAIRQPRTRDVVKTIVTELQNAAQAQVKRLAR